MLRLANTIAVVGLTALLAVTGLILFEVVVRSGAGIWLRDHWPALDAGLRAIGIDGISDLYAPLGIVAVAACFPAMVASRSAITVRFVTDTLPWRWREIFGLLGDVTLLGMFALMGWWLTGYARDLFATGETTWILMIPRWPAFAIAAACIWIATLIQIAVTAGQATRAIARSEPPARVLDTASAE